MDETEEDTIQAEFLLIALRMQMTQFYQRPPQLLCAICLESVTHLMRINPNGYCLGLPVIVLIKQIFTLAAILQNLGYITSDECIDASDILNRKHSLCGQINNVICYFSNRNSVGKQSLMNAYCSSLYDCELWDLSHPGVSNLCTAWKRGLRRIWGLSYDSHSNLLPLLSDSLPIFDLICSVRLIFCISVYQVTHQLLILYHFTAYFMDVLSHRLSATPYFVVNV